MSRYVHVFRGQCHCGNLEIRLHTERSAQELPTRNCQCGFCTRHGARTVSDPNGMAVITLNDSEDIRFYRFALRTAAFLICGECGVYGAAILEQGGKLFATLNVNLFPARDSFQQPVPTRYDQESIAERRARRVECWTPARLIDEAGERSRGCQ